MSVPTVDRETGADSENVEKRREHTNTPLIKRALKGLEGLKTHDGFRRAPLLVTIRLISWIARCSLRKAAVLHFPRWNVRMFLPPAWRGFGKFIFTFRENYEPELAYLERILSPGKVFIDVGANFGVYTLVASRLVGTTGKVIAFEPTAQSFAILQQNIELNHFSNVRAFQVALAQSRSRAWLYHGRDPVGNSLRKDPLCGSDGEEVQIEKLDQVLEENGIGGVDAIKIDVEGAEALVLQGAIRCLTTRRPIVIFEFNPRCAERFGLSPYAARDFLKSLGYEFVVLDESVKSDDSESWPTYFNIVAVPSESAREYLGPSNLSRNHSQVQKSEDLERGRTS